MSRPRVLQVHHFRYPEIHGGVDRVVTELINALESEEVIVLEAGDWEDRRLQVRTSNGRRVYRKRLRAWTTIKSGLRTLFGIVEAFVVLVQIDRLLRREHVDLVHLHTLQDYHWYFSILAYVGRCRYVITLHRNETLQYPQRDARQQASWARTLSNAAEIVTVSQTLTETALRNLPLRRTPTVVRNGVGDIGAGGGSSAGDGGRRYVVCVGVLSAYKGHETVIRAWPEVLRAVPGLDLVIIGSGELAQHLGKLAAQVSCPERIRLVGALPHDEVLTWVAGACAYLMPSRSEGLPIALLEAAALGKPLIVSDLPVFREVVSDGVEGRLVPVDDASEWARSIAEVLADNGERQRMSSNARARYEAEFRESRMLEEYRKVYERAVFT